jgi:hypothetical protein
MLIMSGITNSDEVGHLRNLRFNESLVSNRFEYPLALAVSQIAQVFCMD